MKALKKIAIVIFFAAWIFITVVLVLGSEHNKTFTEEIKSWGNSEKTSVLPDKDAGNESVEDAENAAVNIDNAGNIKIAC